ncbi:MAG: hypothetical protein GXP63_06545 [DPANN group archaeon]|nr:hypothetical protein [DPANN group archaeon]
MRCLDPAAFPCIGHIDYLEHALPGATITLFGSYSRGEDTMDPDMA